MALVVDEMARSSFHSYVSWEYILQCCDLSDTPFVSLVEERVNPGGLLCVKELDLYNRGLPRGLAKCFLLCRSSVLNFVPVEPAKSF